MAGRPRPKVENPGYLFKRIMGYVFKYYGIHMITVFICIILSVVANIQDRNWRGFSAAGDHGLC